MLMRESEIILDEGDAANAYVPTGTTYVKFGNPSGRDVDCDELIKSIARSPGIRGVRGMSVMWNSRLTTMSVALLFPNLESAGCESWRMEDLRPLVSLDRLKSLGLSCDRRPARSLEALSHLRLQRLRVDIWKPADAGFIDRCGGPPDVVWLSRWKQEDFAAISGLRARKMQILDGAAKSSAGLNCVRLHTLEFAKCTKLHMLTELSISRLIIYQCRALDLASIGRVRGLRSLEITITGKPSIESLDFLQECQSLEVLSITAGMPQDLNPLIGSKSLRFAWLWLPTARLLEIGKKNPNILLGNTEATVKGGQVFPQREFSDAVNAYFQAMRHEVGEPF